MEKIKTRLTQNTATGMDDSGTTTVYVIRRSLDGDVYYTCNIDQDCRHLVEGRDYEVMAEVEITHPFCMAGTIDGVNATLISIARQETRDAGLTEENDYGIEHWKR